jgi:hypothetical protein
LCTGELPTPSTVPIFHDKTAAAEEWVQMMSEYHNINSEVNISKHNHEINLKTHLLSNVPISTCF